MSQTGFSSYLTKSSSYPTSNYGNSYHLGRYGTKNYVSSYTKPNSDYGRPYGGTSSRSYGSSTSSYLSKSNYAIGDYSSSLSKSSVDSRRSGLLSDRYSRRDSYGTKSSVSLPTSRFLNNGYSSSYQPSSRAYDRNYGRFSQERTVDVSRDLREMSLGPRIPSIRRSSSQFDLASSRSSVERASVGRDFEDSNKFRSGRTTPRVHPTMGAHAYDGNSETRVGGRDDVETEENGRVESKFEGDTSHYGSYRSGRSPSTERRFIDDDFENTRAKRYSSVDRFNNRKTSVVPKSVNALSCSGLRNIGNTCFMNSVLQCLAHTQPLVEYCLESQYEADVNHETSRMKGALITAYADLMNSMWSGQDTVVSPTKFKCEVAQFAKLFVGYNQQDAQEFLLYLLQGLHEDVNRVRVKKKRQIDNFNEVEMISASEKARKSWKEHLEFENSRIVDLFEGQLKSALTCTQCGYVSNTFDPVLGLSIPIKKCLGASVSLIDCLELFTSEEVLEGNECTMCARCKKKQKSTKRLAIQKFPQILIINLKRFNDENAYRSKLSTEVRCPLRNLDLKRFSAEKTAGPIVYDLYAVSNHSGTPSGGHYTASAQDPYTKEWQYFNDHRVSSVSEEEIITSDAYILFYGLVSGSLTL